MRIHVKDIGIMRQADFELGNMTIICGKNNTGKTYVTYTLYGFLLFWQRAFLINNIDKNVIESLTSNGVTQLDLARYAEDAQNIVNDACSRYSGTISKVFAAPPSHFQNASFKISLEGENIDILSKEISYNINTQDKSIFSVTKKKGESVITFAMMAKNKKAVIPSEVIRFYISESIKSIIFDDLFPDNKFIASAERTGTAIFRRELNFARNKLLNELTDQSKEIKPFDLLLKVRPDYPIPIESNVDFTRRLEVIASENSFISEDHPEIIDDFRAIIGGDYVVKKNEEIYYNPSENKKVRLTLDSSSSAVRAMLDIGFYIKHAVKRGDLLMIDEPELSLHPENQVLMARLLARLVNIGIKVFITTHSDYIIKELNTLIMLKQDKEHIINIRKKEGYKDEELLDTSLLRVYVAGKDLIKPDGAKRRKKCFTLMKADIDQKLGIEVTSFDNTINHMNQVQSDIMWGE